jgi:hypothetical protein
MSPPGAFMKRDGPPSPVPSKASKLSSLKKKLSRMNVFERRASESTSSTTTQTPDPHPTEHIPTPQETPWQQPGPANVREASLAPVPVPGVGAPTLFVQPTEIPRTPRNGLFVLPIPILVIHTLGAISCSSAPLSRYRGHSPTRYELVVHSKS